MLVLPCLFHYITIIVIIFSKNIINLFVPGISEDTLIVANNFLKISALSMIVQPSYQIFLAYLNTKNRQVDSLISGFSFSLIQIIFIVLSSFVSVNFVIYGYLISNIIVFLLSYFYSKKNEFRFTFSVKFSSTIKSTLILSLPIFMSNIISQVNVSVDDILHHI